MLQSVASCNDGGLSELLVRMGANVDGDIKQDLTPLQWATWHGNVPLAKLLLDNNADVELCSQLQKLALDAAAQHDLGTTVQELLAGLLKGRAGPAMDRVGYGTELYIAAALGHAELVRVLLKNGADMYERGERGTPLHVAATGRYQKVVRLLMEHDR
jgi:ankyrin repeat protein